MIELISHTRFFDIVGIALLVELSGVRIMRQGHPHGYPYGYPCKWSRRRTSNGYPRPMTIYLDIHTGFRADIRVELSVLRSVRPDEVQMQS